MPESKERGSPLAACKAIIDEPVSPTDGAAVETE